MEYPLISEYRDAILSAEDNFKELSSLRPVLDGRGNPVMSSGNFAVIFKMRDETTGKLYAVKCFIKEQERRNESYRKIADELECASSSYIVPLRYLEDELFVDSEQCDNEEFPVVLMDWVEGETLSAYIERSINNKYDLEMLSFRFNRMAAWLLTQSFAHGDLKPDNILVREDGSLVLVDYDGMYVPSMKGELAREIGSPDYRHPLRTETDFDEHIDDFSIAVIALSLKAIALKPELKSASTTDTLLFTERDFHDPSISATLNVVQTLTSDKELSLLMGAFFIALAKNNLELLSFRTFITEKPEKPKIEISLVEEIDTRVSDKDLAEGIKDEFGVIYSKDWSRLLKCPRELSLVKYSIKEGTKVICEGAFRHCESLQSVTIPDSVMTIGAIAFCECYSLKNVSILDSVKTIGDSAFWGCGSLESVTIPDSITAIGDIAFCGCDSLKSVSIPDSVTAIGDDTFNGCGSLKSVTIPDSVTAIGNRAFSGCESLESVTIPDSVTAIGNSVFSGCGSLKSVIIPDSVTAIGDNAFAYCESLESVTIPDSVTAIGDCAFGECDSLKSVSIPDSVTAIGYSAFWGCGSLESVIIPDSVRTIGKWAFYSCDSLESVSIPDKLMLDEKNVFSPNCKVIRRR